MSWIKGCQLEKKITTKKTAPILKPTDDQKLETCFGLKYMKADNYVDSCHLTFATIPHQYKLLQHLKKKHIFTQKSSLTHGGRKHLHGRSRLVLHVPTSPLLLRLNRLVILYGLVNWYFAVKKIECQTSWFNRNFLQMIFCLLLLVFYVYDVIRFEFPVLIATPLYSTLYPFFMVEPSGPCSMVEPWRKDTTTPDLT